MLGPADTVTGAFNRLGSLGIEPPPEVAYVMDLARAIHDRLASDPLEDMRKLVAKSAPPAKVVAALEAAALAKAVSDGLTSLARDHLNIVARTASAALNAAADDIITQLQPTFAEHVAGYRQALEPLGGSIDVPKRFEKIPVLVQARDEALRHLEVLRTVEQLHTDLERCGYQVNQSYRWTAEAAYPRIGSLSSVLNEPDVPLRLNTREQADRLATEARVAAEAEQAKRRDDHRANAQAWVERRDALAKLV